jgi:hypothetical protein
LEGSFSHPEGALGVLKGIWYMFKRELFAAWGGTFSIPKGLIPVRRYFLCLGYGHANNKALKKAARHMGNLLLQSLPSELSAGFS